jgi:lipoyl(octanoyl) transferase
VSSFVSRDLGLKPLPTVWADMKRFTELRSQSTPDEVWFVEHEPIFTLGLNGNRDHVIAPGDIPVLKIDRGGQVTYHGPGQLVVYPLLDIKRLGISIRGLVQALEAAVIDTVASYGVDAYGRRDAPGVYVGDRKLAAVGLKIRKFCSYHGLSINVDMDLEPFKRINPCGYEGLEVTQLKAHSAVNRMDILRRDIEPTLMAKLDYFSSAV